MVDNNQQKKDSRKNAYTFTEIEEGLLESWKTDRIYKKSKEKGKNKKKYYFLDGPPYTSGRVHIGTAWNKSLKDALLRYKRMNDFDVWDRAGYDMHGMPTELAVEKELGLKFKEEIIKMGVAEFVQKCKDFSIKNMNLMTQDFLRMGVWMDFDNAYMPITKEYIEGEWWLIKKAHENKRLYEGEKTMHWCAECATALAKHELEYENVEEDSIFLKFPIIGSEKEFLVIWTTTPWTIPFNLGVMANPNLDYIKAKVEDEIWILSKGLAPGVIGSVADKKYQIIEEFKGDHLEGLKYKHPLYDELAPLAEIEKESEKAFTVVMSDEYVDLSAGSGLVHMAPGCGPEDYEVGHREGIPPFNNLTEEGIFPDNMGKFSGFAAKKDDKKFIEALEQTGLLIASTKVEHDYAHCWRCKSPVIFRTTSQWFFKVEDLKENMRELNKDVKWIPDYAGSRNFDSWLSNLRDNGITRQRFWGTPLPVWKCKECSEYVVIGSVAELKEFAGKEPKDLHKPFIDEISWDCKCGGEMKRIPDILDVWIDAGSASWNCLDYPHREDYFKELFPADFILEGIDQIRGWFNLLFVASMVSMERPSYKAVYMHGFVQDSQGRKMSKSLGNYILPEEVIGKYGADTLRFYTIGGTNPGIDLHYNFDDMNLKSRNLSVLWNVHNYLIDYMESSGIKHEDLDESLKEKFGIEEKYIFSRLHSTIKKATLAMEDYRINEVPLLVEQLFLELSRTYIQMVRDKATSGSDEDKKVVAYAISEVLIGVLKIFSIICPFITDKMYLNLKDQLNLDEESVHLCSWPKHDESFIDEKLESSIETAGMIMQAVLRGREKAKLGVRWPLSEIIITSHDQDVKDAVELTSEVMKNLLNVKDIHVRDTLEGLKTAIKGDYNKLGPDFGDMTPKIIAKLLSESPETVLGHIQKENKYIMKIDDKEITLVKDHLTIQHEVPEPYLDVQFRQGMIYLNTSLNDELLAEGFAREIIRHVQQLRKEASMKKTDSINLTIELADGLHDMIDPWVDNILGRVGAKDVSLKFGSENYLAQKSIKIRGNEIKLGISEAS